MSPSEIFSLVGRTRKHGDSECIVRLVATAHLPTRHGDFKVAAFWNNQDGKEHAAVYRGDLKGQKEVLVRMHSECLTGDAFGSLKCDCRDQLEHALECVAAEDTGLVLYLRQEGRGIGLVNKIRAYALQDEGLDTVDANLALGFQNDERDYEIAARMIQELGIRSVRLMTNNTDKVAQLERYGVAVTERVPHQFPPNSHNARYLATKAFRSGHQIEIGDLSEFDGKDDKD